MSSVDLNEEMILKTVKYVKEKVVRPVDLNEFEREDERTNTRSSKCAVGFNFLR